MNIRYNMVDLRFCKKGDTLISSQGGVLEYVARTPYNGMHYLDHVVKYKDFGDEELNKSLNIENGICFGTRTHDGKTYVNNPMPEVDHDIVAIVPKGAGVVSHFLATILNQKNIDVDDYDYVYCDRDEKLFLKHDLEKCYIKAPYMSEVVNVLREKYSIDISVRPYYVDYKKGELTNKKTYVGKIIMWDSSSNDVYVQTVKGNENYNLTLEDTLIYALKTLKK